MSKFWIDLLFTIGSSTWLYTKLQRYSGNNTRQSAVGTAIFGVIIFVITFLILETILK